MLKIFNKDGFNWWIGVVENRQDPEKLGRCKVRVFGYHTDSKELLPTQYNNSVAVLTDFEPIVAEPSRETIQFFPQGPLRFYDLRSEYPLTDIDLSIKWVDKRDNTYPLYLSSGDSFTVKLLFRLKSLYEDIDEFEDEQFN